MVQIGGCGQVGRYRQQIGGCVQVTDIELIQDTGIEDTRYTSRRIKVTQYTCRKEDTAG